MTEVQCTVASCHFWKQGDRCGAEKIVIKNQRYPGVDFGQIGESASYARTSRQTFCETYRPR